MIDDDRSGKQLRALLIAVTPEPPTLPDAATITRATPARPSRRPRLLLPVVAGVVVAAGAATLIAVTRHDDGSPVGAPGTATPTASVATTNPVPPASSSAPTTPTTSPSAVATCARSQLRLTAGEVTMARGATAVPVRITNISTTSCALEGYPTVRVVGHYVSDAGAPIGSTKTLAVVVSQGSPYTQQDPGPHRVVLSHGGRALFYLGSGAQPTPGSDTAEITILRVGLPGVEPAYVVPLPAPGLASTTATGQPLQLTVTAFGPVTA